MVTTASPSTSTAPRRPNLRWRVVDIVVASVLAVAGGLVFVLWNSVGYSVITSPFEAALPGLQALFHGVWLFPGVLVALVVRKPGAALYGEIVAASVSATIGTQWGSLTLLSGLIQGLGAELVLAFLLYRAWGLIPALLAGAGAGVAMVVLDLTVWYVGAAPLFATVYAVCGIISGALFAGLGSWLLMRGLARTGALSRFAAGRELRSRAES
ncbi:ECF transporter S component [Microcella daejeonensis]|uniref:ECF transporter S component n=1 Tax=Microcella daejeonensis TaxID=2994971 RepID=UPI00226F2C5B|nr:ECF transporter S component [Microcella daejeonensis]WAB83789.1 ECF transporter S component [Microcella daejeonensis]